MSDQEVLRNSASDVAQMRKDWVESYHFNAEVELLGLLDDYDAMLSLNAELLEALEMADAALSGANMNMSVVEKAVKKAIAKARSQS